jgi:hypothetical protein
MKKTNLNAYVATTGVLLAADDTSGSQGVTLLNATTYYIPIPAAVIGVALADILIKWAAALVGTFTIEATNLSSADLSDYDATAGNGWQQLNPPTAYVPTTGSGNTSSAATVTAGGTAAGTADYQLTDIGQMRFRIKAAITTGGLARFICSTGRVK